MSKHYYVFVDGNNGHFEEYYNFTSESSSEEINQVNNNLKNSGSYGRLGCRILSFENELNKQGITIKREENNPNRLSVDRIIIRGIMGNY